VRQGFVFGHFLLDRPGAQFGEMAHRLRRDPRVGVRPGIRYSPYRWRRASAASERGDDDGHGDGDAGQKRRCFMTGGTYAMTADPNSRDANGVNVTNGCFSINPRTIQDVRNCWCGRGNTSPRVLGPFSNETQNQALRDSLGCRP